VLDEAVNKRSCQPEKPENSQVKTWGPASTLGLSLDPHDASSPTGENLRHAKTCGMWRIRAKLTAGAESKSFGSALARGIYARTFWKAPGHLSSALKDSNYRTNSEVHLARDLLDGHTSLAFG
jgi:hypothetical protein